MGFKMKPVNRNLEDEFHRATVEGIDAVFERMYRAAGNSLGLSFAEAFDVSDNTVKTWRRRGAVSTKFLQGFAEQYGVTLDYLLYGREGNSPDDLALSKAERDLVAAYRVAPAQLREAALRVLQGAPGAPPPASVSVTAIRGNAAGRDVKISKRVKKAT